MALPTPTPLLKNTCCSLSLKDSRSHPLCIKPLPKPVAQPDKPHTTLSHNLCFISRAHPDTHTETPAEPQNTSTPIRIIPTMNLRYPADESQTHFPRPRPSVEFISECSTISAAYTGYIPKSTRQAHTGAAHNCSIGGTMDTFLDGWALQGMQRGCGY